MPVPPTEPSSPRRAAWRWLLVLAAVALAAGLTPRAAQAQAAPLGQVTGSIQGAGADADFTGTQVVLLQFKLDEKGQPKGAPIQTQESTKDGHYSFTKVPIESKSVYQIGARYNGKMLGSEPFTFPDGHRDVKLDLHIPALSTDSSGLRIEEAVFAVEPHRGAVWVTEVLHLDNPTQNEIEGLRNPMELALSDRAEQFQMLRQDQENGDFKRSGDKLLVYGNIRPGPTTIAFRYRLPVALGVVDLRKRYPHPIGTVTVLTPAGSLKMRGSRFNPHEAQEIQGVKYDTWVTDHVSAGEILEVRLSGVPARQEIFLLPTAAFLLVMAGIVFWFFRRRLAPQAPAPSAP
jgi:hypothetical protein